MPLPASCPATWPLGDYWQSLAALPASDPLLAATRRAEKAERDLALSVETIRGMEADHATDLRELGKARRAIEAALPVLHRWIGSAAGYDDLEEAARELRRVLRPLERKDGGQ